MWINVAAAAAISCANEQFVAALIREAYSAGAPLFCFRRQLASCQPRRSAPDLASSETGPSSGCRGLTDAARSPHRAPVSLFACWFVRQVPLGQLGSSWRSETNIKESTTSRFQAGDLRRAAGRCKVVSLTVAKARSRANRSGADLGSALVSEAATARATYPCRGQRPGRSCPRCGRRRQTEVI